MNRQPAPKAAELDGFDAAGMPVSLTAWERKRAGERANVAALARALGETAAAFDAEFGAGRAALEQAALNRLADGTAAARAGRMLEAARAKRPKREEE